CDEHRIDGYCIDCLALWDQRRIVVRTKTTGRITISQSLRERYRQQMNASVLRQTRNQSQRLATHQHERSNAARMNVVDRVSRCNPNDLGPNTKTSKHLTGGELRITIFCGYSNLFAAQIFN